MSALGKRFVRDVYCSDEFGGASPDTIVVTITPILGDQIVSWSQTVRRLGVFTLSTFHPTPSWYERNWEDDQEQDSVELLGDLFAPLETVLLVVGADSFWWTAQIEGSSTRLTTESIGIDELT